MVEPVLAKEEVVRAAFARHEHLAPAAGPLRAAIERAVVRRRRKRRVVRLAGVVLIVLALALPGYGLRLVGAGGPAGMTADSLLLPRAPDRPLNVLVLGLDTREKQAARADMILIAHIPADRSKAYLLSLPRDLMVSVPVDPASGFQGGDDKLSNWFYLGSKRIGGKADLAGGARLTMGAITRLTGLGFDAVATVDFSALRAMTDAVGGVLMCLDQEVRSTHTKSRFPLGCRHLGGREAMDLLRQRKGLPDGALDRDRHGRQFLKALLAAARSGGALDDVRRADRLLRAAGDGLIIESFDMDRGDLLWALRGIDADDVVGMALPTVSMARDDVGVLELAEPAQAGALFRACEDDRVAAWLASHPGVAD